MDEGMGVLQHANLTKRAFNLELMIVSIVMSGFLCGCTWKPYKLGQDQRKHVWFNAAMAANGFSGS